MFFLAVYMLVHVQIEIRGYKTPICINVKNFVRVPSMLLVEMLFEIKLEKYFLAILFF
jgi:hypothetical protein